MAFDSAAAVHSEMQHEFIIISHSLFEEEGISSMSKAPPNPFAEDVALQLVKTELSISVEHEALI